MNFMGPVSETTKKLFSSLLKISTQDRPTIMAVEDELTAWNTVEDKLFLKPLRDLSGGEIENFIPTNAVAAVNSGLELIMKPNSNRSNASRLAGYKLMSHILTHFSEIDQADRDIINDKFRKCEIPEVVELWEDLFAANEDARMTLNQSDKITKILR